jgi:hypothetical protein
MFSALRRTFQASLRAKKSAVRLGVLDFFMRLELGGEVENIASETVELALKLRHANWVRTQQI